MDKKTLPIQIQIPLIIILSGLCFYFGSNWHQKSLYISENGISVQAKVLEVAVEKGSRNRNSRSHKNNKYNGIIEFQVDNRSRMKTEVSSQGGRGFNKDNLFKGNIIDIVYDPEDPNSVFVLSFMGLWFWPYMLYCSGFFIIIIGAIGILYRKKNINYVGRL